MSEGIDIKVSATGAAEAKQALTEVAEAEQRVAAATAGGAVHADEATKADKDAAEGKKLLAERQKSVLEGLRALGPELGMVGDMIATMATASLSGGVSMGIYAVAIAGIAFALDKFSDVQSEHRQRAEEMLRTLRAEREEYEGLERAVMTTVLAEEKRRGVMPGGKGQPGGGESMEKIIGQVTEIGKHVPLGKAGIEAVSTDIASSRAKLTDEQRQRYAEWYYLEGQGMDQANRMPSFSAYSSAHNDNGADLAGRMTAAIRRNPSAARRAISEGRQAGGAETPSARAESAFDMVAKEESAGASGQERPRSAEDIRSYIEHLIVNISSSSDRDLWAQEAEPFLARYGKDVGNIEMVRDENYTSYRMRPARKGERGESLNGTMIQYHGGVHTHIYGQDDPAGVPAEGTTGNTGR
jgi:hypothetical protein